MNKILVIVLSTFIAVITNSSLVQANASASAPVTFQTNIPSGLGIGDEANTTIRFVSETDIPHIVISVSAYEGLSVMSGGEQQIITGVSRGETFEIEVRIRLDEEVGYLAVYATTSDAQGRDMHKNTVVPFGTPGEATRLKLSSDNLITASNGETLFLMQAEVD